VDDPHLVCGRKCARDLRDDGEYVVEGQDPFALQTSTQGLALQQLHHDEGLTGLRGVEVEDVNHMRMVQLTDDLGFALEAEERCRAVGQMLREHLHRDRTPQAHVLRSIEPTHAAFFHQLDDAIAPPEQVRHGGRR